MFAQQVSADHPELGAVPGPGPGKGAGTRASPPARSGRGPCPQRSIHPGDADSQAGRGVPRSQGQEGTDLEFEPQPDLKVSISSFFVCFATLPLVQSVQMYMKILCKVYNAMLA